MVKAFREEVIANGEGGGGGDPPPLNPPSTHLHQLHDLIQAHLLLHGGRHQPPPPPPPPAPRQPSSSLPSPDRLLLPSPLNFSPGWLISVTTTAKNRTL